jgi:apolipoprotein N-acyltransferase
VTNLAVKANAYLLTGTMDATPYAAPVEAFNAAMIVRPDGTLGEIYRKIHLVPFGEYVPLRKLLPFMKWLTPITDSFERGREFTVFEMRGSAGVPPVAGSAHTTGETPALLRFGAVICFEDTVPDDYRRFVRRGVDFMVNLTNDAWFKTSPSAEMHLANAIFRAAETRRPLVRCTNNGMTCVVDQFGFVGARLPAFVHGTRPCDLELRGSALVTFYTRHGDWFVGVCALLAGGALLTRRIAKP